MNIQNTRVDKAAKLESTAEGIPFALGEIGVASMLNIANDAAPATVVLRRPQVRKPARTASLAVKRSFDVVCASILIVLLSPLLIVTALAVKLTSRGPVFFKQRRWGRGNTPFFMYKFRSMYVDLQDRTGVQHTVKNDPRVTVVGRFIRRYSIDELPQLINVLKGDMSLVGPRAHVLGMHAAGVRYEDLVPEYFARHAMRPGITGLAQVRGLRGEVEDEAHARARVAADLEYIRTFSVMKDVKIMLWTVPAVLSGRAAM